MSVSHFADVPARSVDDEEVLVLCKLAKTFLKPAACSQAL